MKRIITVGMATVLVLLFLGGCAWDQRYVSHDAACDAMPCRWKPGVVNE